MGRININSKLALLHQEEQVKEGDTPECRIFLSSNLRKHSDVLYIQK